MAMRTRVCRPQFWLLNSLLGILAVGGLLLWAQPAAAQGTCIQDVWKAHGNKQNLTCTANDVTLSEVTNVCVHVDPNDPNSACAPDNKCTKGQPVTFTADFQMVLTADTRYDIGFYIATGGQASALTGQCAATQVTSTNAPVTFRNLDAAPDTCGDITGPEGTAFNPQIVTFTVTTQCIDPNNDGFLDLPFCTTWRQPGSNEVCQTVNDVFPGSPSKCNCGTLSIPIFVEPSTGAISKTVTKSTVTYQVQVSNTTTTHTFTLSQLCDSVFGTLAGSPACPAGTKTPTSNTCGGSAGSLPATINAGESYTCTFDGEASIDGSAFSDTVTAAVVNEDGDPVDVGSSTATVTCSVP